MKVTHIVVRHGTFCISRVLSELALPAYIFSATASL